jgi:hypothetical protein
MTKETFSRFIVAVHTKKLTGGCSGEVMQKYNDCLYYALKQAFFSDEFLPKCIETT